MHEWRRGDYKHTQRVVERLILLGEMDRAVQLLLETDLDNPNYYTDGIKYVNNKLDNIYYDDGIFCKLFCISLD